jgi:hypothetical protein
MVRPLVVLAFLSAFFLDQARSQTVLSQPDPVLTGSITRSVSLSDFDVNGYSIISSSETAHRIGSLQLSKDGGDVFVGEHVAIYGKIDHKRHKVEATKIIFLEPEPRPFSGIAVIDRILKPASGNDLLLRADGYVMKIDSGSKVSFASPLAALADVKANDWITYHGILNPDGILVTETISFQINHVSDREGKLLKKTTYDPAAIPAKAKQGTASKYLTEWNPKKTPPYKDQAMQERVTLIGTSLIPSYQRQLPAGDPTKIAFLFQVVDRPNSHEAFVFPSGIILIPHQVVERLQNDSQVAAVLAYNMAIALEKQEYRMQPAYTSMSVADFATGVGDAFVPGLSLASLAMYPKSKSMETDLFNQSGRVSLGLLHDAGYDIQQAPVAWWILASKPGKNFTEINIPSRSLNLYRTIGLVWKNYPETAVDTETRTTLSPTN